MALLYYQNEAYRFKRYNDSIQELVYDIINSSACEIKDELSALLQQCMSDKRCDDLPKFILHENRSATNIYFAIPPTVINLCKHFWRAKDDEQEGHYWNPPHDQDNGFGMVENGVTFEYFPPGADQTPISSLLDANEPLAVDFIIDLMNECVETYSKSKYKNTLQKVIVTDGMDRQNWQWHSLSLWCMYRGAATHKVPYSLQSIHMALERHLLYLSKEGLYDRCEAIMQRLLFDCHSSSVSAVVGSVVLAYPNEYWREALTLFRTLEFIRIDSVRLLFESRAEVDYLSYLIQNPYITQERMESCKQKHRNTHLESIFLQYQFYGSSVLSKENNEALVKNIFGILDKYRKLLDKTFGQEKIVLENLISRIDRRQLKVKGQKQVKDGVAIEFETKLSKNARKMSEETRVENQEMLKYTGLLNWAKAKFKGEKQPNRFNDNPQAAIKDAQNLMNDIENGKKGFITDEDSLIWVSACLLKFYKDALTDEQLYWCENIVEKLKESIIIDSLNATDVKVFNVLPILIELYPEEKDTFTEIMLHNLLAPDHYVKNASSIMISDVKDYGLWEKDPKMMKELVMRYIDSISIDALQPRNLEIILGLIPNQPDQEMKDLALRFLKIIPNLFSNEEIIKCKFDAIEELIDVLHEVAYLFMHTESVEIMNSLGNTNAVMKINSMGRCYLTQLIYEADKCKKSDRFWAIWNSYRPLVAELIQTRKDGILRAYTFNVEWSDSLKEWHSLMQKNLDFLTFMGENCQGDGVIFEGLIKILTTIGSKFKTEGMGWIARAIELYPTMNLANTTALLYLEMVMMPYIYTNKMQIRKNHMLLEQVRTILNFMVSKSSVTGFILRDMLN